jgi:hypothetical protein
MDSNVVIEGSLNLVDEDDDDSSVSSEGSSFHGGNAVQGNDVIKIRQGDEEEEIEVFDSRINSKPTSASSDVSTSEITQKKQPNTNVEINEGALESSYVEDDEFGIRYQKKDLPQWFNKHEFPEHITDPNVIVYAKEEESNGNSFDKPLPSVQDEDDEFAFSDAPETQRGDDNVMKALQNIKKDHSGSVNDEPEELNFDEELEIYKNRRNDNPDLSEVAICNNKLYTNSFNLFTGNQQMSSSAIEEPLFMDNPSVGDSAGSSSVLEESKKALADFIGVYGQGMGDQEILLLDMEDNHVDRQSKKPVKKNNKGNDSRKPQKINIDKSITAIAEGDEEEEDDDEDEEGDGTVKESAVSDASKVNEAASASSVQLQSDSDMINALNESHLIEEEWDSVVLGSANRSTAISEFRDDHKPYEKWSYTQFLSYLHARDLSTFEKSIVVSEPPPSSKGFFTSMFSSTSSSVIQFPDAQTQLKFPFLVAQIDYDPFDKNHLNILRTIYYTLMDSSSSPSSPLTTSDLLPVDPRWENLGFQGKDPRTDLNRAIKLLALLQVNFDFPFSDFPYSCFFLSVWSDHCFCGIK